jgi:hypothetical protein
MRTEADRWLGALFHGWVEVLTLFLLLTVMLALIGWAWNRGFRPADRGPLVPVTLLVPAFGLVLLLRQVEGEASAWIIAGGVVLGGLLSRGLEPRSLILPVLLMAALLGTGLLLSALLLSAVVVLVPLLSPRSR